MPASALAVVRAPTNVAGTFGAIPVAGLSLDTFIAWAWGSPIDCSTCYTHYVLPVSDAGVCKKRIVYASVAT